MVNRDCFLVYFYNKFQTVSNWNKNGSLTMSYISDITFIYVPSEH